MGTDRGSYWADNRRVPIFICNFIAGCERLVFLLLPAADFFGGRQMGVQARWDILWQWGNRYRDNAPFRSSSVPRKSISGQMHGLPLPPVAREKHGNMPQAKIAAV